MEHDSPGKSWRQAHADTLASTLAKMNRRSLIKILREAECGFKMDFTDEFLAGTSMQRLRHTVLAAILQDRRLSQSKQELRAS